jgi:hypothetical protein
VSAEAASVYDAFGDALVIEVEDLLAQREVFEQRRPPGAGSQRVLIVGNDDALLRGKLFDVATRDLMQFAGFSAGVGRAVVALFGHEVGTRFFQNSLDG